MSKFVKMITGDTNNITMGGTLTITDTTPSINTATGALVVDGGAGVAGSLYATNIFLSGVQVPTNATMSTAINNAITSLTTSVNVLPTSFAMNSAINSAIAPLATSASVTTNIASAIAPLATSASVTTNIASAVAPLATTSALNSAVAPLATIAALNSAVAPLATSASVTTNIASAIAPLATTASLSSYVLTAALSSYDTISARTAALSSYALSSAVPTLAGTQTLTGVNTFTNQLVCNNLFSAVSGQFTSNTAIGIQGLYTQWNRTGLGNSYIINQKGLGTGGISFGESTTNNVYTENMFLDANGGLTVNNGGLTVNSPLRFAYTTLPTFNSTQIGYTTPTTAGNLITLTTSGQNLGSVSLGIGVWIVSYTVYFCVVPISGSSGYMQYGLGTSTNVYQYQQNQQYVSMGAGVSPSYSGFYIISIASPSAVCCDAHNVTNNNVQAYCTVQATRLA